MTTYIYFMKKLYFLVVVLFMEGNVRGQNPDDIINFPDSTLKARLLQSGGSVVPPIAGNEVNNVKIDANDDGEIQISEANAITYLNLRNSNITDITGLASFENLKNLDISYNPLASIDLTGFDSLITLAYEDCPVPTIDLTPVPLLEQLDCTNTGVSVLDLSVVPNLNDLRCSNNGLTSLDLSFNPLMQILVCHDNQLTYLNLDGILSYQKINCSNNLLTYLDLSNAYQYPYYNFGAQLNVISNPLVSINLKNGETDLVAIDDNATLEYICIDESELSSIQYMLNYLEYSNCVLNSYCSFIPGGTSYVVNVNSTADIDGNGCDASDINVSNLKFNISNGTEIGSFSSNDTGFYAIPVSEGSHLITPILENPSYFNISPPTVEVTFPETTSPFTQNFCITPNGIHTDLEVAILPTTPARPGFDAHYKIIIKNKGNMQQSGSVSLTYNDAILDYVISNPVSTTQATSLLSWAFANLEPFETREINVILNVNSPMETPAVNGDDVLTYTATITSEATDEMPLDNTFTLPQIVVNSFDPNDKTCLEGTSITPDMIGQYVHYMIRFENTGTFDAENIVVKDMIDVTKFDVSSLVALSGSHPYVTRIAGNKVEFIFEGINLPFDDANNDGYVVFKIKTLPTLALGDSFSNTASIYFDFNHPIVTEPAVTTFAVLKTKDFEFNDYFTLYPNPTNGVLNITTKQAIELQSISIYNVLEQMVVSVPNAKGISNVDVSSLSTGNYFIKVVSDKGISNAKFIKQ